MQDIPSFLQTNNGQLSLPALFVLLVSSMVAAIFVTIAAYVLIVRRFNGYFEIKERVSGIHSSFLEAVDAERNSEYAGSERSSSSSSSSSVNSSMSLEDFEQQQQTEQQEDFEEAVIREINSKKITQTQQQQLSNKRERGSFASSAREISV